MGKTKDIDKQIELIKRGTVEIISQQSLRDKLKQAALEKRPLIIKAGFDPSAPDIHLGHTVLLRKLRHFQQLGHMIVFLIGDFTAMIGDPSGRNETRPTLTKEDVLKNAQTYKQQVSKILDVKKMKVVFNSSWLGKLNPQQIAELLSKYTVARVLERDDFLKRYKEGKDISLLEFFYPLLQAYDSVALEADVELGGTDQKFNLIMGRTIQERYGQKAQVVITMPLLEGTDGVQKMSKSYNNYIGINENAKDMYGKTMSISDEMMIKYYELLTDMDLDKVKKMHPMEAKKQLAFEIVKQYHGENKAQKAQADFEQAFQKQDPFSNLKVRTIECASVTGLQVAAPALADLLCPKILDLIKSKSEFRRLVGQGAISVNGVKVTHCDYQLKKNTEYCIKVGKTRFCKILLK
ncbi:MAG: tyrosine--tRNA ligase [Candidatus Omnitrophica bacterium]|nr:tyrosine--tRNA ligase [Candidatus Omnitrophota bacterium]